MMILIVMLIGMLATSKCPKHRPNSDGRAGANEISSDNIFDDVFGFFVLSFMMITAIKRVGHNITKHVQINGNNMSVRKVMTILMRIVGSINYPMIRCTSDSRVGAKESSSNNKSNIIFVYFVISLIMITTIKRESAAVS